MEVASIGSAIRTVYLQPAVAPTLETIATIERYQHGQSIYHSADPRQFWYRILTGAARKCAVTSGGTRCVVDFLFPQDLFGIGSEGRHRFAAEVLSNDTAVARYPRRLVERIADSDLLVAREIREAAFQSLRHLEARVTMLRLGRASERVSAFLLELAERRSGEQRDLEIAIPMSRYDIADYLAMTVETVCRVLTQLRLQGIISFSSVRSVRIRDWDRLEGICGAGSIGSTFGHTRIALRPSAGDR